MIAPAGSFVAGSIVSAVVLDDSKFNASADAVKGKTGQMGAASKLASGQFTGMGVAMTAAGGAIIASLGGMISKYATAGDEVHKMGKRTGFSTERLSELSYAAQISGTNLTSLEKGVKKMSKTIVDANSGLATYQRAFDRIGVSYQDLMKMSPEEQFNTLAVAIANVEDPTVRAATAQEIFGRAGTELLPLFDAGAEGMAELSAKAHELGIVFDQDAADGAAALVDAQTTLKESLNGLAITLAKNLVPPLTEFIGKVSDTITKISTWAKAHPELTSFVLKLAGALGGVMAVLGPMLIIIPKIIQSFTLMKTALGGVAGGLGTVAAVGAAAFVGWQVGRLIGELTGLDTVIQGIILRDKDLARGIYDLSDATKDNIRHTDTMEKKQQLLSEASKKSGKEITNVHDALKILKGTHEIINGQLTSLKIGTDSVAQSTALWGSYLKEKSIPTATEYYGKIEELKNEKNLLKQALDAGQITLNTYKISVEKVDEQIRSLTGETKKAKEETQTWLDYIHDKGLFTVEEKGKRVDVLQGFIEKYNEQLKAGIIDLPTWTALVKAANDEIESLSNTTREQAIVSFRDMGSEAELTFGNIAEGSVTLNAGLVKDTQEMAQKTTSLWSTFTDGIRTKWTTTFSEMLQGTTSFADGLKGIFDSIKSMFFDMIAQMVTKWVVDWAGTLIKSSVDAGAAITKNVADSVSNVANGVTAVGTAVADALTGGLASAIGSAIGAFFGTLAAGSGQIFYLRGIKDNTWTIAQHGNNAVLNLTDIKGACLAMEANLIPINHAMLKTLWQMNTKQHAMKSYLKTICDKIPILGAALIVMSDYALKQWNTAKNSLTTLGDILKKLGEIATNTAQSNNNTQGTTAGTPPPGGTSTGTPPPGSTGDVFPPYYNPGGALPPNIPQKPIVIGRGGEDGGIDVPGGGTRKRTPEAMAVVQMTNINEKLMRLNKKALHGNVMTNKIMDNSAFLKDLSKNTLGEIRDSNVLLKDIKISMEKIVNISINLNSQLNLNNQIDPNTSQQIVRKVIIPDILDTLRTNKFRSQFKSALGIA